MSPPEFFQTRLGPEGKNLRNSVRYAMVNAAESLWDRQSRRLAGQLLPARVIAMGAIPIWSGRSNAGRPQGRAGGVTRRAQWLSDRLRNLSTYETGEPLHVDRTPA